MCSESSNDADFKIVHNRKQLLKMKKERRKQWLTEADVADARFRQAYLNQLQYYKLINQINY